MMYQILVKAKKQNFRYIVTGDILTASMYLSKKIHTELKDDAIENISIRKWA